MIGFKEYKHQFCKDNVSVWRRELETLSEIAFTKGYRSKFTYFMRTIKSFEDYVDPIHEVLNELLLPTIFGQEEQLPDELTELFTLSPAQGGLDMPNLKVESPQQYAASTSITAPRVESIITQSTMMIKNESSFDDLKKHQQSLKAAHLKSKMETIDASLPSDLLPLVNQARDKGASSWLNAIPLEEQGLVLNKQEFVGTPYESVTICHCPSYQATAYAVRVFPATMPCHAKRVDLWRRGMMESVIC